MRLGIGSYAFSWSIGVAGYPIPTRPLDAMGLLRAAISVDAEVVQFADNLPLTGLTEDALNRLQAEADAAGVAIEVGTRGIDAKNLRAHLALAQRLGSPLVRVVIDVPGDEPTLEEARTRLHEVLADYRAAGVTLAIENHDRFKSADLADLVRDMGDGAGICLDTVNSFGALEGPEVVVRNLAPFTVNLHVKDFIVQRAPHMMGFEIIGTPAGMGRLNLPWLLREVEQFGRCRSAIIEQWASPEQDTDATAAKEAAWASVSMRNLRAAYLGL